MNDFLNALPPMLSGQELLEVLTALPPYDENIRLKSQSKRLIALMDILNIYIPSQMSIDIYSKLYLAIHRSLQKKIGVDAIRQRNENYRSIRHYATNGLLGGCESFSVISCSGNGKSSAINRAIEIMHADKVIEVKKPYTKIIPCLVVQCSWDSSVKGLLLEILRKLDEAIGSDYYTKSLKGRQTTDLLIGTVSQTLLNHCCVLVIDEIQNIANSTHGNSLVKVLLQLVNSSGIATILVGTPEAAYFLEKEMQYARRFIGLYYNALEYNQYFRNFCTALWEYQYTKYKTEINEDILYSLYQNSGGVVAIVVSLMQAAQEIAILNGKERLDLKSLTEAYKKRLAMLHPYIEPIKTRRRQTAIAPTSADVFTPLTETITVEKNIISQCVKTAKEKGVDVVSVLNEYITTEVVKI